MPATFLALSQLLDKVEATKRRLEIVELTANYLKTLDDDETQAAVDMMVGRAFSKYSQSKLDVSWVILSGILEQVCELNWVLFRKAMAETGDIGTATQRLLEGSKTRRQMQLTKIPLTIAEVCRSFEAISQAQGSGSRTKKERQITALLSQATPVEAKYLVKIFTGEMRTGLSEGLMEQAVAEAFDVPLQRVQYAGMVLGDIGEVAGKLKSEGSTSLDGLGFTVFRPVKLMLAQTAESVREALEEQGGAAALEYKYDGARVQIHIKNGEVRIFSRRLSDVTESLPEVVEVVKKNIQADRAIVEGEVIAFDAVGYPIAFQHLMRRFKRVKDVADMQQKIPLTLYLFDILYLNGESLIAHTYLRRRQILSEQAGKIALSSQIITDKHISGENFFNEALAAGHEGIMAKKLDSPYTPGRRGKKWLKIKSTLEPLDLVITAAEYGYGRRKGWLSDYYLGARDEESGEFLDVGKTFKGLTDAELTDLTEQLKAIAVESEGHRVVVLPKIVVEVAYNEIQQSHKYQSGMALRFARITRIRSDKSPEEACSLGLVREIYDRQFRNKGKYNSQEEASGD
jgi:DNA ligase-1